MINAIGEVAGKVYRILEQKGEQTVAKLKTATSADAFVLDAAIGWLAREDKVQITKSGRSIKVGLK